MLAEEKPPCGVIHCFSTGRALAEAALALGFYISLSGIVTFRNAGDLRAIVPDLPLDRLLIETDAPYLAPVPLRGKTNEPAFLVHTAAAVAALKGIALEELARAHGGEFLSRSSAERAEPRSSHARNDVGVRPVLGRAADRRRLGGVRSRRSRATDAVASRYWWRRAGRPC